MVNNYENHRELTTKNRLIKNWMKQDKNIFEYTPITFIYDPSDTKYNRLCEFIEYYKQNDP